MRSSLRFPFEVELWAPIRHSRGRSCALRRRVRSEACALRMAERLLAKHEVVETRYLSAHPSTVFYARVRHLRTGKSQIVEAPVVIVPSVGEAGYW